MLEQIKNLRITGTLIGLSTAVATVTRRGTHALLYKIDGESCYQFDSGDIQVVPGTLLYIPQGETYRFRKTTPGDSRYCLVNFLGDGKLPPTLFTVPVGENLYPLFKRIEQTLRVGALAGQLEGLSLLYHLMSVAEKGQEGQYTTAEQKQRIEPALDYFREHLLDLDFRVACLPQLCGMSAPAFRKIFVSRFGTTPKKYLLQQRMRNARQILDSGEYESIAQIAQQVGMEDSLYFSKCFKAFYGIAPSQLK